MLLLLQLKCLFVGLRLDFSHELGNADESLDGTRRKNLARGVSGHHPGCRDRSLEATSSMRRLVGRSHKGTMGRDNSLRLKL